MMGAHSLSGKSVFYEEAVRVPFLIRAPSLQTRQIHVNHPVSQINIVPTLLDLLGKKAPENLPGESLLPLADGRKVARRPCVHRMVRGAFRAASTDDRHSGRREAGVIQEGYDRAVKFDVTQYSAGGPDVASAEVRNTASESGHGSAKNSISGTRLRPRGTHVSRHGMARAWSLKLNSIRSALLGWWPVTSPTGNSRTSGKRGVSTRADCLCLHSRRLVRLPQVRGVSRIMFSVT